MDKEEARHSNVAKTWQAIADAPLATDFYYGPAEKNHRHRLQGEAIYLNGIGTTATINCYFEGATGTSTSERHTWCVPLLAERYQDGDRLFGFDCLRQIKFNGSKVQ